MACPGPGNTALPTDAKGGHAEHVETKTGYKAGDTSAQCGLPMDNRRGQNLLARRGPQSSQRRGKLEPRRAPPTMPNGALKILD